MRLANVNLTNFRACRTTAIELAPDLTVLVGENASGKSAIIDALRLVSFPASGRPTAWFAAGRDLSNDVAKGETVEIQAVFTDLTEAERAVYMAELVDAHDALTYTASFATDPSVPRRSVVSWTVGEARVEDPEPANRRRISHVYLPPMRDAVRDLEGSDSSQLHNVLRILLEGDLEEEKAFLDAADESLKAIADHPLAMKTQQAIQAYFSRTTPPRRDHVVGLNQRALDLYRTARLLRIQLAERDIELGDIASTGLGYANLLYIAMIVLQLSYAPESDLTLLLVEEPEAHLHPQLQLVLLDFLRQQAADSGQHNDGLRAAGKVQVLVTTHSPNLASTVSINNVVMVARDGDGPGWSTQTTSLWNLGLTSPQTRKVDRYLTATRASLLFARDVILVEGMAELLLLPELALHHLTPSSPPPHKSSPGSDDSGAVGQTSGPAAPGEIGETMAHRRVRQFRSATIVSVDGVDFEPYLRLLLNGPHPRVDKVVVVTDRDHTGAGDQRREKYLSEFSAHAAAGRLYVEVGGTTLEAELFREPGNEQLLHVAFKELHPKSDHRWDALAAAVEDQDLDTRAEKFARAIRSEPSDDLYLDISKGDFAHVAAEALKTSGNQTRLVVPSYLANAIDIVTGLESARS